ncbi:zinc-type alcohol dehydrogenase-like protein C16A3.02c [Colletotrichum liriopes]|uniref:Zinc-type alcohol dehydrogenase-like protein C16A3.02c n=1 Tax=Colletotrichum liriopes TaxID=708192 RepID=A0AA37H2N9_9PEZI|nr:zinc-type alcohol dehydrogenase-like protein C16A3.02c [Colletotrichum liriopes]
MRSWVRQHRGHYKSSLKLVESLPTPPIPGPDSSDIIVRVSYVALEFSIVHFMGVFPAIPFAPPLVPELCVSGTVAVAGGMAPRGLRHTGTRVLAMTDPFNMVFRGTGALTEYMRLPEAYVAMLPETGTEVGEHSDGERLVLSLAQGAGLISNGSTALAMVRAAKIRSGQRVLVNGASGSVGHIAAQLCLARGAFVAGVASGANEALVRGYGIHEFVNYKEHASLPDYLASVFGSQPFDSILDCVGSQALYESSPRYLHPSGSLVNVGTLDMEDGILRQMIRWVMNSWCPTWLGGIPRSYIMFSNTPNIQEVLTLVEQVEQGRLKVFLDSEFAMADLFMAYERVTSKRARGKVLIQIRPEQT